MLFFRKVAEELLLSNARIVKVMEKNKLFDRSKNGNKGCFRNEALQYTPFVITNDWKLPKEGVMLEFDFVYLYQSREQMPLKDGQFEAILSVFSRSKLSLAEKIKVYYLIRL